MLTSIRGITAASLSAGLLFSAAPAFAAETVFDGEISEELIAASAALDSSATSENEIVLTTQVERASEPVEEIATSKIGGESGFELSGNVALVSGYRFRGVSFSDGDPALQGGIDLGHSSGLYVGTWASSITGGTPFGEVELDVYAGWSGEVADGVSVDIGLLYYVYPTGDFVGVDTDYFEPYASVSFDLGPVSTTVGAAYAWDQNAIGNQDNLYLYSDFELGLADTPISLTAHVGYTDGVFSTDFDQSSFDWGLGASWAVTDSLSLGVNYVDTQGPSFEDFTDAGFFFTLGYSM